MSVDKAFVVGLDVDMLVVVGEQRLVGFGLILGNVACEDPRQRRDRKSTRLNSSHSGESRMPSSA